VPGGRKHDEEGVTEAGDGDEVLAADQVAARLLQSLTDDAVDFIDDLEPLQLLERLREKNDAAQGNDVFIVVVPLDNNERNPTAAARARLGNLLDNLRSQGLLAAGMIGDPDPYVATMNPLVLDMANSVFHGGVADSASLPLATLHQPVMMPV